jgi:hypothetical protein
MNVGTGKTLPPTRLLRIEHSSPARDPSEQSSFGMTVVLVVVVVLVLVVSVASTCDDGALAVRQPVVPSRSVRSAD